MESERLGVVGVRGDVVRPSQTCGFVSSRPRKKGFDKFQDKSLGGIAHLIPITKMVPKPSRDVEVGAAVDVGLCRLS